MIWFVSDTHYGHKNIVKGVSSWSDTSGCRPFETLDAHNDWLVKMINDRVARQDTLYHLGDWSFGGKDKIKEFREQLNCERIHLVKGNHDHHITAHNSLTLFESVSYYLELDNLVLMHYPIESWNGMETGVRHLHGHVHGHSPSLISGRYDVGVDALGLVSMDDVRAWPKATTQRHTTIEGGSRFGTN